MKNLRTVCTLVAAIGVSTLGVSGATAAPVDDVAGDLVSSEPFLADWLPPEVGTAEKVLYRTQSSTGALGESTGLVLFPEGDAPDGGWPVVSWAHGTQGTADACAPSVSGPYDSVRDRAYLGHWLSEGYAVVASDYAGLGSAGDHAYLHGETVAHNIVDMVRAAHHLVDGPAVDEELSANWVSVGHSQGAGAALYTARYATGLGGDDLRYRGTVGTGTPVRVAADITALGPDVATEPLDGHVTAYVTYMLDGIRMFAPELDGVLSAAGKQYLAIGREQCLDQLATTLADASLASFFTAPVSRATPISSPRSPRTSTFPSPATTNPSSSHTGRRTPTSTSSGPCGSPRTCGLPVSRSRWSPTRA